MHIGVGHAVCAPLILAQEIVGHIVVLFRIPESAAGPSSRAKDVGGLAGEILRLGLADADDVPGIGKDDVLQVDIAILVRCSPELRRHSPYLELGHIAHQAYADAGRAAEGDLGRRRHQRVVHPGIPGAPGDEGLRVPVHIHPVQITDVLGAVRVQIGDEEVGTHDSVAIGVPERDAVKVQRPAAIFPNDLVTVNVSAAVVHKDIDAVHQTVFHIGRIGLGRRALIAHHPEVESSNLLPAAFHSEGYGEGLRLTSCQRHQHRQEHPDCHSERSEESSHGPNRFHCRHSPCSPCRCCLPPAPATVRRSSVPAWRRTSLRRSCCTRCRFP